MVQPVVTFELELDKIHTLTLENGPLAFPALLGATIYIVQDGWHDKDGDEMGGQVWAIRLRWPADGVTITATKGK